VKHPWNNSILDWIEHPFQNPKLNINLPSFMKTEKPRAAYSAWYFSFLKVPAPRTWWKFNTTFSDGCLGSHIDEERSEMRYVMRIAESSESSKLWTHLALPGYSWEHACWSVCSPPLTRDAFLIQKGSVFARWFMGVNFGFKAEVVPRRGDLQFLNNNESCYTVLIKYWVAFNLVLRVWYFSWLKFKPNHQQQELLSQGSWQIKLQQMALGIDRCVRVRTEQCLFARLRKEAQLGSPIKQEDPPNLSILLSGGKETNKDSLSKGDWSGKSPCCQTRKGVVACVPVCNTRNKSFGTRYQRGWQSRLFSGGCAWWPCNGVELLGIAAQSGW
jgi:hypothetical protein